jgi:predicted transcriptional regulator
MVRVFPPMNSPDFDLSLIDIKRSNGWVEEAKGQSVPKSLFGEFWQEGELAILFADTGRGKSALAVQIAESIARGKAIEPFHLTAKAQKVLYLDCELTRKQFEMRYAAEPKPGEDRCRKHYKFSERFYRAEIRRNRELPEGFKTLEQYIRAALEPAVKAAGARVLIVDNLTYLRGPSDSARESLPLMRELIRLKEELGLSVLVIAHTPKRNASRRISVNDLQGSKVLANLADSIFAIGQSGIDAGIRYLKQLKGRSAEMLYDENHTPAFELKKRDGNFLGFVFRKFSEEAQHLKSATDAVRRERAETVAEMTKEGMSQRAIASELGMSVASVNRYLHMAEPWSDDRYNDDLFEDEPEEEEIEPEPEEGLYELLISKLKARYEENMALRAGGGAEAGYDDIYEEIASKRTERYGALTGIPYERELASTRSQGGFILQDLYRRGEGKVLRESTTPPGKRHQFEDDDDDDDDEDPMARYGLTSDYDAGGRCGLDDVEDEPRTWDELVEKYNGGGPKQVDENGIGYDAHGRMRRRTSWGWDYCVEALE